MLVAAYCRVSTDKLDQANSFQSQCKYFSEYIANLPDWTLYRIYADNGMSGTAADNREEFCRMIEDGVAGCFNLIITKEVSRFSRNILDTIYYTRFLRQHGVFVLFVNDGINTADADAELRLSIMASLAQEESRRTSSRVKWGQQRRMEQGIVFGRSLLGYDVQKGQLYVNPVGAKIVQQIFDMYTVSKQSSAEISAYMEKLGYKLPPSRIIKILRNEKYCGDLVQKKTYTPDYLSHKKKYNHGQEALVILRNHHTPIISRELWDCTQKEIELRARKKAAAPENLTAESLNLQCGQCSSKLIKRRRRLKNGVVAYWRCVNGDCSFNKSIRAEQIEKMIDISIASLNIDFKKQATEAEKHRLVEKIIISSDTAYLTMKYLPFQWVFKL